MSKLTLLLLCVALFSCGSARDVYHVRSQQWAGDSIQFELFKTASPEARTVSLPTITASCWSCNLVDPPRELSFNDSGIARAYMPETLYELDPRIHLHGSGIDTTVIVHSRPPEEDRLHFHLTQSLVGRVKVLEASPLYASPEQDSTVTFARLGDEMNIFGEDTNFFYVHHPMFGGPLYLLRYNGVRLY
jgi:hypothetical protein